MTSAPQEFSASGMAVRTAATLFVFAVVLWLLSGLLVRWMHGAETLKHA